MNGKIADLGLAHGNKHSFRKITVTVPQDAYERLIRESARRKIAGEPNQLLSALLREAVSLYLDELDASARPM
jgi:transcriptional regulator of met regulon